jgi:hypothetical protein
MLNFARILAVLLLGCSQAFAAVTLDSCSTGGVGSGGSGTSITNINQTVGAGLTNGILTVFLVVGSNSTPPTGMTAVWDNGGTNQSMTAVPGSPAINGNESIFAFSLLNPTSGNKNLTLTWTGSIGGALTQACSFQGASGVANFNSANGGVPQTVAITAGSNDMAFAAFSSTANFTSTAPTQVNFDNSQSQWAIGWARASGPNPTLTGNPGHATSLSAGFSITAFGGGGGPTCGNIALRGAGVC